MTTVITEPEQEQQAKALADYSREEILNDIRFLLKHPQFRRQVWRFLHACQWRKQSAEASGSWTYFNEGRRSAALTLEEVIRAADPKAIGLMDMEFAEANQPGRSKGSRRK